MSGEELGDIFAADDAGEGVGEGGALGGVDALVDLLKVVGDGAPAGLDGVKQAAICAWLQGLASKGAAG